MKYDDDFYCRLHEAERAGLNDEWALRVAMQEVSLEWALGDMDMDLESLHSGDLCECEVDNTCGFCEVNIYHCKCTTDEVCEFCKDEISF